MMPCDVTVPHDTTSLDISVKQRLLQFLLFCYTLVLEDAPLYGHPWAPPRGNVTPGGN